MVENVVGNASGDISILSFLMVFILHVLGAYQHWRKMKKERRVKGSFLDYLLSKHPLRSFSILAALLGSAWMSCLTGVGDNINPELMFAVLTKGSMSIDFAMRITATVTTTFGLGYAVDSGFGSAKKKEVIGAEV